MSITFLYNRHAIPSSNKLIKQYQAYRLRAAGQKNNNSCLRRDPMPEIIKNIIPKIYCVCFAAYRRHSILQFDNFSLISRVGPQQGDPLTGLLV